MHSAGGSTYTGQSQSTLVYKHQHSKAVTKYSNRILSRTLLTYGVHFLSRVIHDTDIVILCNVHFFVCVPRSSTVLYQNGSTYCHTFFSMWQSSQPGFLGTKHLCKILSGSSPTGPSNTGGVYTFSTVTINNLDVVSNLILNLKLES